MRKLTSFIVAFLATVSLGVIPAFAESPPEPSLANAERSGEHSRQGEPFRRIRLVRLADNTANGTAVVSGDALVYSLVSDDGVAVALTTTSGDSGFAGIAVTAIQTGDSSGVSSFDYAGRRNWGWIVTNGFITAKAGAGGTNNNSAGHIFITSTDSGAVTGLENQTGATAAAITNVVRNVGNSGGFFFDAAGTSTTVDVFVRAE